jgi:L-histidine N-alpha-methyltransferase
MNFDNQNTALLDNIELKNLLSENGKSGLINEIVHGLQSSYPNISSKFFYNDRGSELFEDITNLDEYYPSRLEKELLKKHTSSILGTSKGKDIIELGSGDCSKISLLLDGIPSDELPHYSYIPVDVSKSAILQSAGQLVQKFPNLSVNGQVLDFTSHFNELPLDSLSLICFFGSTIGNFDLKDSQELMKNIADSMNPEDILIVGFDRVKDISVLDAAYNDSLGLTDIFNKNILNVVNSIIDSDFNTADFEHVAFFNESNSRIEMHLEARRDITIHSPYLDTDFKMLKGERIHTENSYKYTTEMINGLAEVSGLKVINEYTDKRNWFSLVIFSKGV